MHGAQQNQRHQLQPQAAEGGGNGGGEVEGAVGAALDGVEQAQDPPNGTCRNCLFIVASAHIVSCSSAIMVARENLPQPLDEGGANLPPEEALPEGEVVLDDAHDGDNDPVLVGKWLVRTVTNAHS
jgi:hypothetical protein